LRATATTGSRSIAGEKRLRSAINIFCAGFSRAVLTERQIQELSSRLGKVLIDRFTTGETDPEKLKAIALEHIQRR
jgi:hypothetical protein